MADTNIDVNHDTEDTELTVDLGPNQAPGVSQTPTAGSVGATNSASALTDRINTAATEPPPQNPAAAVNPSNPKTIGGGAQPATGYEERRSPDSIGASMRAGASGKMVGLQTIKNIKMKVEAVLGGISMPVSQLAELKQGELIDLSTKIGDALNIVANGEVIARGEIVVIEDGEPRFGITLTEIV